MVCHTRCWVLSWPPRAGGRRGTWGLVHCRPRLAVVPSFFSAPSSFTAGSEQGQVAYQAGPVSFPAASPAGRLCCSWPQGPASSSSIQFCPPQGRGVARVFPRPAVAFLGLGCLRLELQSAEHFLSALFCIELSESSATSACRSFKSASHSPFITDVMFALF